MVISIRKLCFVLLFGTGFYSGFSQVKKQTSTPGNQNNQRVNNHSSVQQAASTAPLKCLNKKLSLAVHIVTDSLNNPNVTQAQINAALTVLNADFSPICLSFFICKQDTIYNYEYYKFQNPQDIAPANQTYAVANMINVYVVGSILPPVEAGFAGKVGNFMVLSHGCITDPGGKCWSHEMGHFFSLAHTFDTSGGLEFVNESNCAAAGDSICDTPADINPAPVNAACQWTGTNTDPHGQLYTPIIGNIMSYHPSTCKTPFTVGQLNKMLNWYISYRNYLY
jgi:hypothetical protein